MSQPFERYLTKPEERDLLKHVNKFRDPYSQRDYHTIQLMLATGIRVGTAVGLTLEDAKGAIRGGKHLVIRDEIAKGKRGGYSVFLTTKAFKALRGLVKIRKSFNAGVSDKLLLSRKHQGLSIRSLQKRVKGWGEAVGLENLSPHWFRHTCAMRLMNNSEAKDPRAIAQVVLGHKALSSTMVYTRPTKESVREALEKSQQGDG